MKHDPPHAEILASVSTLPLDERVARLRSRAADPAWLTDCIDHATGLVGGETDAALHATETLVAVSDDAGDAAARVRARRARARALAYAGRLEEALDVTSEAVGVATAAGEWIECGRARLASMHALGELGRHDEAIAAGEAARDLFERFGDAVVAARADINLGIVQHRRGRALDALARFDRAEARLPADDPVLGHLQNSRGEALLALDRFEAADGAFAAALRAFESADAALPAAIAEGNLADMAARRGDLGRALRHFESARRRFEHTGAAAHEARLRAERAEAIASLGLPEDAVHAYRDALRALDACGLAAEAARARCGLGYALVGLGEYAEAETALAAAARGFDDLEHAGARARVDVVRGELALLGGHDRTAHRLALRALAECGDAPLDAADARHLVARASIAQGDTALGAAELEAAIALVEPLGVGARFGALLETRGRLRAATGRLDDAITDLEAAVAFFDRGRADLPSARLRKAFFGGRSATALALVDTYSRRDAPADRLRAFAAAEQARSRTLLDRVDGALLDATPAGDDAGAHRRLRGELRALYDGLERAERADNERIVRWRRAVESRERELAEIEDRLAATRRADARFAAPCDAATVQAALAPGDVLLSYALTDAGLVIWRLTADGVDWIRRPLSAETCLARLDAFGFQVSRALARGPGMQRSSDRRRVEDARAELAALHEMLIAPVAAAGAERYIIVPYGPLHRVPWAALWDGERSLIDTAPVVVAPSASLWNALRQIEGDRAPQADMVVGVADAQAPAIEHEARALADALGVPPEYRLFGADATRAAFLARAGRVNTLHCAAHGRFVPGHAEASGIRLADGWCTPADLARVEFRAELVILSGCETGLSAAQAGDDGVGLSAALFAAGAANVLVSLWRVHDATTLPFMCALHEAAGTTAERVRSALLESARREPHPAFWAPFTLIGRG